MCMMLAFSSIAFCQNDTCLPKLLIIKAAIKVADAILIEKKAEAYQQQLITLQKDTTALHKEILKDTLEIMRKEGVILITKERLKVCRQLDTLNQNELENRAIKIANQSAEIKKLNGKQKTWCFGLSGGYGTSFMPYPQLTPFIGLGVTKILFKF